MPKLLNRWKRKKKLLKKLNRKSLQLWWSTLMKMNRDIKDLLKPSIWKNNQLWNKLKAWKDFSILRPNLIRLMSNANKKRQKEQVLIFCKQNLLFNRITCQNYSSKMLILWRSKKTYKLELWLYKIQ